MIEESKQAKKSKTAQKASRAPKPQKIQKSSSKKVKDSAPPSVKAKTNKSKKSKKWIITVILIAILILSALGGVVAWVIIRNRQPEMSDWADVYLTHIKTVREKDRKEPEDDAEEPDDESFWNDQAAKPEVSFYESTTNSPTMVVNYISVENNLSYNSVAVYSIQNEEIYLLNYENTNLFYVYDIDADTYNFYLKHEGEKEDTYVDIEDYFKDPEADDSAYEEKCSTDEESEDYCGDVFIEETVELPSFEYRDNMSDKELAGAIADTSAKVVTEEEVKQENEAKMLVSAEEVKQRVKEKEEAKKEYFMVGDQKIQFGKYEQMEFGGKWGGRAVITLNPDFTATRTRNDYDPESGENIPRTITTKFEVRPLRHGDVLNTCGAPGCPPYDDSYNGRIAIIVAADSSIPGSGISFFTQTEAESVWGKNTSSEAPAVYDFMPTAGHQAIYYRFLGK